MRRVRKAVGGNDKSASGATRLAGTENFKRKYIPGFPVVRIVEATPGRVITTDQLEGMGLVAPPEPISAPAVIQMHTSRSQRLSGERQWPDYQRCLERAPLSMERGGPDRSSADFDWCKLAARFGWSIETANKLLEVSQKAQERSRLSDPGYVLVTAQNAAASVAARVRQRGRG
jgi:hypothetical protein